MTLSTKEVLELVGLLLLVASLQVGIWRWMMGKIATTDEHSRDRDKELAKALQDTREDTVRKDDMMVHINRIERGQENLQAGIDRVHTRMDGWATAARPGTDLQSGSGR